VVRAWIEGLSGCPRIERAARPLGPGYNPWLPAEAREHRVAELCERFGGNGPAGGGLDGDSRDLRHLVIARPIVLSNHLTPVPMLKSIALYVVLVGLPLTGLFVLLDWGQRLVPPPAIGGHWSLGIGPASTCPGLASTAVLSIEQSGRFLRVRVDDMPPSDGRLDDGRVTAEVPVRLPGCGDALALEATLDANGLLVGRLGQPGCAACPPTALAAERLPPEE
jgi:hypothetical protein